MSRVLVNCKAVSPVVAWKKRQAALFRVAPFTMILCKDGLDPYIRLSKNLSGEL